MLLGWIFKWNVDLLLLSFESRVTILKQYGCYKKFIFILLHNLVKFVFSVVDICNKSQMSILLMLLINDYDGLWLWWKWLLIQTLLLCVWFLKTSMNVKLVTTPVQQNKSVSISREGTLAWILYNVTHLTLSLVTSKLCFFFLISAIQEPGSRQIQVYLRSALRDYSS